MTAVATTAMDYPIADMAKQFGVSLGEFVLFWNAREQIITYLGMKHTSQRHGGR